jgi:glycosyltransferase involved in cell wall biosynthesis
MTALDVLAIDHAAALAVNRRIYAALVRRGLSVEVAIPERVLVEGLPPADPPAADDPPLHRLPFQGTNLRYLKVEGLDALLQARQPRLVHLDNEPDTPLAWRLGGWAQRHGRRLTARSAESEFFPVAQSLARGEPRQVLRNLRTRAASLLTRRRVDRVFCLSQQIAATWRKVGFAGRTVVMPLGFEPALFHPDALDRLRRRAALSLTEPTVSYFGRVMEKKGPHVLIAALARLGDLRWQLLLNRFEAEAGYAAALLQPLQAAGLAERVVTFAARHDEMASYMRAADVVVVPSLWEEQYGRVAAEAMAVGAAVVASRRGALPEILGEAGVLLPSGDVAALAACLRRLLTDAQERARLGAAAAARAAGALSLERQADVIAQTFRNLLAEERRG